MHNNSSIDFTPDKPDVLNRIEFMSNLKSVVLQLAEDKKYCSFAIDGLWGSGKSYVLDWLERELEPYQDVKSATDKFFIFHYNAWKYDYYEEPAVAIVSAMLDEAEKNAPTDLEDTGKQAWNCVLEVLKTVGGEFVKNKIGVDLVSIADNVNKKANITRKNKTEFDDHYSFKKTIEKTREQINCIADDRTILFIVDELDRCLPEYAIKVLERLHNIFEGISNTIVLIAVDSCQLSTSVKRIYGEDTNVEKYMRKFISFTLRLDNGKTQENIWTQFEDYFCSFNNLYGYTDDVIDELHAFIPSLLLASELDIRTQEKVLEKSLLIHKLCSSKVQDFSLMLAEIINMVVQARVDNNIRVKRSFNVPYQILKLNYSQDPEFQSAIGSKLLYLLEDKENGIAGGVNKGQEGKYNNRYCKMRPYDIAFYIMQEALIDDEKDKIYIMDPNRIEYQDETEVFKNFNFLRMNMI